MTNVVDFYEIPINVGDIITFPSSGDMMNGTVLTVFKGGHVQIVNENGNKSVKFARSVINKTALMNAYKEIHPENCI